MKNMTQNKAFLSLAALLDSAKDGDMLKIKTIVFIFDNGTLTRIYSRA